MKIINTFLLGMKDDEPFIPIKERSILLFGSERILDEMSRERKLVLPRGVRDK
jgi:hypothetical protein